jgi:hypothetical protein
LLDESSGGNLQSLVMHKTFVLLLLGLVVAPASAEERRDQTPSAERIAELIQQLGHDEFATREVASEELKEIGLPAFAALEAAGKNPDREIRYRSQRILALVRQIDMQRRLDAFLAGKDEGEDYQLPGWGRFRKSYGDDTQSRTLFVEMQRADAELMQALEEGPQAAADAMNVRTSQFQQAAQFGLQQASLGQIAATLFVAAQEDVTLSSQTTTMVLNQCFQSAHRDILANSSRREIPRKMLGAIIERTEGTAAYIALNVAYQLNLSEGVTPAVKVLSSPVNRQPHMVSYALMMLARVNDPSHLPIVEKLLDDKSIVTRMQEGNKDNVVMYEVQVRDAALATAVLLSKQEISAYFDGPQAKQPISDLQQVYFNARLIGFSDDAQRTKVFDKWAKYKAEQAKSEQPNAEAPQAETPAK